MLTPAEELGLSGQSLDSRVSRAFHKIPESQIVEIAGRLRDEAYRRHLIYLRDGKGEAIRIMPRPLTILPDQIAYIHSVSLTILNALKRLPELYLQDPSVREILRLGPEEEAWFNACRGSSLPESDPVFARLDAVVDLISPMWKNSLHFVEPNLCGVGGLHLVPTCDGIVKDVVLPLLKEFDGGLNLEVGHDFRDLLMQEILDHLETLGRPRRNLCFIEPTHAGSGPDEQEALARYYHDRYGLRVMHADPEDLSLRGNEVMCAGHAIELAYRDYEVRDLLALEKAGVDVKPMHALFRQNRIISSITGDFDQKSCWEVFTDPYLSQTHFHAEERQVFRRHILWTRLLSDRKTSLPDGQMGELLDFVRRDRESLVLKPNRSYGGSGVSLGPSMTQPEWDAAIEAAMGDNERWVVQQLASIPASDFPVIGPDGSVHIEPFYVVMGFSPSRYGLGIMVRASQKQVVNVAQRGGMCAVMVGHAPSRLIGPGPHLHHLGGIV
jgi:hypothetical protein